MRLLEHSLGGPMSAELYGAEISGAMARPAVDVLPAAPARKPKGDEDTVPIAPTQHTAAPTEALPDWPTPVATGQDGLTSWPQPASQVGTAPPAAVAAAATVTAPAEEDAPRKVFGMSVRRPKKDAAPAPVPVPVVDAFAAPVVAVPVPVPVPVAAPVAAAAPEPVAVDAVASSEAPTEAPVGPPVQLGLMAPLEPPPVARPAEAEARARRALLEASENARAYAESGAL